MSSIDFGVQVEPQFGYTWDHIEAIAQAAEDHGLESLWTSDHFMIRGEAVDVNCLEAWTTLSALAPTTKRIRLGTMVASQSYRNPALHAKIAASLDHITGGRVYFGLGAGWKEVEYKAYNIPFPPPGARVRQLDEALEIARRMWRDPVASYQGRYYSVSAISAPKPKGGHIPIVVGGTGTRLLRVTAKHADMANFAWNLDPKVYEERLEVLRDHCRALGRDPYEVRLSAGVHLALEGAEAPGPAPYEKYTGSRSWKYRNPREAARLLQPYVDLGVTHFVIVFPFGSEEASIKLFIEEVAPQLG